LKKKLSQFLMVLKETFKEETKKLPKEKG